jgi:FAD/FMN-containing dehydrogenase
MLQFKSLDNRQVDVHDDALDQLKGHVRGEVLQKGDPEYDSARVVFNGMIDRYPALIVRCSGVADVMAAVDFARTYGVLTSVRGGGHGIAGTALSNDALMISLEHMNSVCVDPANRIAWVSGGAKLGDLDHETAAHGLVCPGGVVSTTGVAGLTTGGGYGWLRAKLGMSIDNLRAVEMVTADGSFIRASNEENTDLFWGIRGGGGNFGVVTTFEFQLHPIWPEIMICNAFYAAEDASAVLQGWQEFMANAPDELTTEFFFWTIPEKDNFPEELHGRDVVIPCAVYYGPPEDGEKVIQPLRELAEPLIDLSGPMPFPQIQQLFDPYLPYGEVNGYWKAKYLEPLTAEMRETLVQHFLNRPKAGRLCPVVLHYLNGVSQRISNDATAFPGRNWTHLIEYNVTWSDSIDDEECTAWVRNSWNELRDKYAQKGGAYLNIDSYSDDGLAWVKETFHDNFPRLQQLKRRYDPMNLFQLNPNIPPDK